MSNKHALSQSIEERIREKGLVPKSQRAFANIIDACDFLSKQHIDITAASVGSITSGKVGGPKQQSLRNNPDFTAYIKARRSEQGSKARQTESKDRIRTGDNKVDAYIQALECELQQTKALLRDLRHAIPALGDFSLEKALNDGVLVITGPAESKVSEDAKYAIRKIIDPAFLKKAGLEINAKNQILCMGRLWLGKDEVNALKQLLEG